MSPKILTVDLYELHPAQQKVRSEAARYNVVACGRRYGKTILGIDLVLETALDGGRAGWFAPEYKLLDEAWQEMKSILGPVAQVNEQQKRMRLKTGGTIDAWAFDRNKNAGRSRKYHRIVIDEAAHCENLETAWTKAIRPTLTDFKGDAWFLSSPKGDNYFAKLFRNEKDPKNAGKWKSWQQPSVTNPRLDPEEIAEAKDDLPDATFRQEYLAEFLADADFRLIPESWLDRCVTEARAKGLGGPRSLALDISKGTGRDRTAAIVGDDLGVLAMVASNRIDVMGAAQLALELSRDYGVPHNRIVFDAGGWAGPDMERYLEAVGIMDADAYRGGQKGGRRFKNRRARCAWTLRQRLDPARPRIIPAPPRPNRDPDEWDAPALKRFAKSETQPPFHIPSTPLWNDLREELLELRYQHDTSRIELETKEKCQLRLGRSPDLADTLIMLAATWDD